MLEDDTLKEASPHEENYGSCNHSDAPFSDSEKSIIKARYGFKIRVFAPAVRCISISVPITGKIDRHAKVESVYSQFFKSTLTLMEIRYCVRRMDDPRIESGLSLYGLENITCISH